MINLRRIWFALAGLAIVGAALGLRLYRFTPPSSLSSYSLDSFSQLPPGLHSDEAFNALAGLRIRRSGQLTAYSDIDQGRSVAHMTLTALIIAIVGPIAESARLTSIVAGLLSILGMLWLTRRLFRSSYDAESGSVLQLIAAAEVAGTYWFVNFSRSGFELITLPMLLLAAFAALWQWLRRPSLVMSLLAGALLGLTLYTYYAAYIVPLVAVLIIGFCKFVARTYPPLTRHVVAYTAAFAIVALPLVSYAFNHTDVFTHRIEDTAAASQTSLPDNIVRTVGGLFIAGDRTTAYNLAGRPLLDPIQSIFLFIGLWVCLRRFKQPEFFFVPIWTVVLMLPAMLSNEAPAFNRMAGAVPGILMLVAIGGVQIYSWLTHLHAEWLGAMAITAALIFTFVRTADDYFVNWPESPGLLTTFSLPERIQAEAVAALPPSTTAYISPSDRGRSIFAYLWQDQLQAESFNGRTCSVAPTYASQDTAWLIDATQDRQSRDRLSLLYPRLESQPLWVHKGTTIVRRLSIPAGAAAVLPAGSIGRVSDLAELISITPLTPAQRDSKFRVQLLWRFLNSTAENWTEGVYLFDASGQLRAQDDSLPCDNSYPTSVWRSGEVMIEDRALQIPADLPSGEYILAVAFYRLSDNFRLPVFDGNGKPIGDLLKLQSVSIR